MKHLAFVLFVLTLATGCSRQTSHPNSLAMNTIESVKALQVIHEGEPWVEVTISQRVDPKAPAYVVGIRESKWANRLRWVLFQQTIDSDRVISRFRFKPVGQTNDITLNRDDFDWYPQVSGFEPLRIVLNEAELGGSANRSQPVRSETNPASATAGSGR
jgi:hypothetical protein